MVKKENRLAANEPVGTSAVSESSVNEVEAYLDRLCGELESLDPVRREEIRREVRAHLQLLIARQDSAPDATSLALAQFGDAEKVGRALARRARLDNIRSWLRRGPWQLRLVLLQLLLTGVFGAWLTVEFCKQTNSPAIWRSFIIGPFIPALIGYLWGTRPAPSRSGYVAVVLLAAFIAACLPVSMSYTNTSMPSTELPQFMQYAHVGLSNSGNVDLTCLPIPIVYTHNDRFHAGTIDLGGWVRFTYLLMWLWVACAFGGVARILAQAVSGRERKSVMD